MNHKCVRLVIRGRVTGVGYRYWFQRQAEQLGLAGWVRNTSSGEVQAHICGAEMSVDQLTERAHVGPRWAKPAGVSAIETPPQDFQDFQIKF